VNTQSRCVDSRLGARTRFQGRSGKRGGPGLMDTAMLRTATARMGEEAVKGMVRARRWGGSERRLVSPM